MLLKSCSKSLESGEPGPGVPLRHVLRAGILIIILVAGWEFRPFHQRLGLPTLWSSAAASAFLLALPRLCHPNIYPPSWNLVIACSPNMGLGSANRPIQAPRLDRLIMTGARKWVCNKYGCIRPVGGNRIKMSSSRRRFAETSTVKGNKNVNFGSVRD